MGVDLYLMQQREQARRDLELIEAIRKVIENSRNGGYRHVRRQIAELLEEYDDESY